METPNKQQEVLQQQAFNNFAQTFEFVALTNNLKDRLEREVDYIFNECTEARLTDSQLRNKIVEAKATRDILRYINKPESIVRKQKTK